MPGVLSLALMAKAGQKLIVPTGNEKEAALIMAKPGHEGCGVFPVSLLSEVTEFFAGRRALENALKQRIVFESVVERAVDFGKIRGQETAKEAALLAAAGGAERETTKPEHIDAAARFVIGGTLRENFRAHPSLI